MQYPGYIFFIHWTALTSPVGVALSRAHLPDSLRKAKSQTLAFFRMPSHRIQITEVMSAVALTLGFFGRLPF